MGKLNYTNRKIDGLKLGQVVAKDLRKRLPSGSSFKAAQRDPCLDLDVSGKALTDAGFDEMIEALIDCLSAPEHVVRLEELALKDCRLTARSLKSLGKLVSLAWGDLRDLDISNNEIRIEDSGEIEIWEDFLTSFRGCYVLTRIDFSGNALGVKAFEILSKVYVKSDILDFLPPAVDSVENPVGVSGAILSPKNLNEKFGALKIGGGGDSKSSRSEKKSIGSHDNKSPEKRQSADEYRRYASTRGLRSIPYLVFREVRITDTCALHFSTVMKEHLPPSTLLEYVPLTPGSPAAQRIEDYDRSSGECRGLVYLPNSLLTGAGMRVLKLGEAIRNDLFTPASDNDDEVSSPSKPNTPYRKQSTHKGDSPNSIKESTRRGSVSEDTVDQRMATATLKQEFKKAKSKLEGDTLKRDGLHTVDLWSKTIKMLAYARTLLLDNSKCANGDDLDAGSQKDPDYTESFPALPPRPVAPAIGDFDPSKAAFSWNFEAMYRSPAIGEGVYEQALTPQRERQGSMRASESRKQSVGRMGQKSNRVSIRSQPAEALLCGLSESLWCQIIAQAVNAEGILSLKQQMSVIRYARDLRTIGRETELRGKADEKKWWQVLHDLECLTYER